MHSRIVFHRIKCIKYDCTYRKTNQRLDLTSYFIKMLLHCIECFLWLDYVGKALNVSTFQFDKGDITELFIVFWLSFYSEYEIVFWRLTLFPFVHLIKLLLKRDNSNSSVAGLDLTHYSCQSLWKLRYNAISFPLGTHILYTFTLQCVMKK